MTLLELGLDCLRPMSWTWIEEIMLRIISISSKYQSNIKSKIEKTNQKSLKSLDNID